VCMSIPLLRIVEAFDRLKSEEAACYNGVAGLTPTF
jgi:hypothetical protein